MLEFVRCVREAKPRWVIWENVTGVLSQDEGRAFGTLLGELEDCGYALAWRVLDAQFFRGAAVCFLSDILCPDAPQEYFLSPTACEGIIRRAERRGRSLPPVLKTALQEAIRSSCAIPDRLAQGGVLGL